MGNTTSPNRIDVLDHGYVALLDHMGNDDSVVEAARVSTSAGAKTREEDRALLEYLFRHRHTTPFEQVRFKFVAQMPIFVARQWIRHRTGSFNELSGRYSQMPDLFYRPERLRKQSTVNKQGGVEGFSDEANASLLASMDSQLQSARKLYEHLLDAGVARELARIVLPLSQYTRWVWTTDLHNLFHFLELRLDSHAQWEFQQYGKTILQLIEPIVPWSVSAFRTYRLEAVTLSARDIALLRSRLGRVAAAVDGEDELALWSELGGSARELNESREKLGKLLS